MTNASIEQTTAKTAVRVSVVSIIANTVLSIGKAAAGILAHSPAMFSDGVHSASDVFSSIIVIIGVQLSAKKSDRSHPYGHERFECVAAIVLAIVLIVTGCFIGADAYTRLTSGHLDDLPEPGIAAIIAAIISIAVKEGMFWYTRYYAQKIDSGAVMADAWHHRSDALSSVGALIGIIGARNGFPALEPIASLLICLFILKAAYEIFKDAVGKMVDRSCDPETEASIRNFVLEQEDVMGIDMLKTRVFGNRIYVDIEICADGSKTLCEGHTIAEQVHEAVEKNFPKIKHIMVHVNPVKEATTENTALLSDKPQPSEEHEEQ